MTRGPWDQALDALEACLDQQERQLDADPYAELVTYVPPAGLGPMPGQLTDRASQLLLRSGQIADRIATQLAATGRQLALAQRMGGERAGHTAYVDRMV